jgi:hypothetical protein
MTFKYIKKCSTALVTKEMQIKHALKEKTKAYTEIPSHPSQNSYHQENKQQMLLRICVCV